MKVYSGINMIPRGNASDNFTDGCLILEGGGFRCLYTEGILDSMMEHDINLSCVVGVSAGALSGGCYVSGQIGRAARVNLTYRHDGRFLGLEALKMSHSLMRIDFFFDEYEAEDPLDKDRFFNPSQLFYAEATDMQSGEPVFFGKDDDNIMKAIEASATLPYIAQPVEIDGRKYMDGGCSCAIPIDWALEQGYEKIVVIRSRDKAFRKKEDNSMAMKVYGNEYPDFARVLSITNEEYNETCDRLDALEAEGRIYVIAPETELDATIVEPDMEKLGELYFRGYYDMNRFAGKLKDYLNG